MEQIYGTHYLSKETMTVVYRNSLLDSVMRVMIRNVG